MGAMNMLTDFMKTHPVVIMDWAVFEGDLWPDASARQKHQRHFSKHKLQRRRKRELQNSRDGEDNIVQKQGDKV